MVWGLVFLLIGTTMYLLGFGTILLFPPNTTHTPTGPLTLISSPTSTTNNATEAPTFTPSPTETPIPASIRLDAVGIPAGWFIETGSPETDLETYIKLEKGEPVTCLLGEICYKITYETGQSSGGIIYWPKTCGNTGSEDAWKKVREGTCGINVLEAGNLKSIDRITFWARGNHGGEVLEFKVGDANLLPIPGRSSGKITLRSKWQQYEISLVGLDLTNAIALFIWDATDIDNPQGAIFYLSEIQFEGVK
jgi:hypothetical protein